MKVYIPLGRQVPCQKCGMTLDSQAESTYGYFLAWVPTKTRSGETPLRFTARKEPLGIFLCKYCHQVQPLVDFVRLLPAKVSCRDCDSKVVGRSVNTYAQVKIWQTVKGKQHSAAHAELADQYLCGDCYYRMINNISLDQMQLFDMPRQGKHE